MELLFLALFIVAAIYSFRSIRVVQEDHRLLILRMGKFLGIRGPGLILLLPFVDKAYDIDLTQSVPEWSGLTEQELRKKIMDISDINNNAS